MYCLSKKTGFFCCSIYFLLNAFEMTKFIFVFEEKEERVEGVRKGESEFNLKLAGFV